MAISGLGLGGGPQRAHAAFAPKVVVPDTLYYDGGRSMLGTDGSVDYLHADGGRSLLGKHEV